MRQEKKIEIQQKLIQKIQNENIQLTNENKELKEKISLLENRQQEYLNEYSECISELKSIQQKYYKKINEIENLKNKLKKNATFRPSCLQIRKVK